MNLHKIFPLAVLAVLLAWPAPAPARCTIYLKDGEIITAADCWEEGDELKYLKYGGTIGIDMNLVEKFVRSNSRRTLSTQPTP